MIKSKIAIILRGVPGSGKSTFVDILRELPGSVSIHAIDDLHTDNNGNFLWDEENADRLYTLNFANFVKSCAEGTQIVVCDAINVEAQSFQKYVEIADQYGYCVYVVCSNPPTPAESTKRNKHHTSSSQARDMYSRWEHWPTPEMLKELSRDDK
tara:strand:+ start:519 stop:980 length:462 start_codon:yes stop_codon:yes gene_type:complete